MNITNATTKITTTRNKHIGILGGTFDPIHYGHINPLIKAAQWLGLDNIKLMPAHIPPHKNTTHANAKQRLTMVNLVCQQYPLFSAETCELERNSPSFTAETLTLLKQKSPDTHLYFFMGMDSLLKFTTWRHYKKILSLCHIVVLNRPNYDLKQLQQPERLLLDKHYIKNVNATKNINAGHILLAPNYHYNISSTQLRTQFKHGIIDKKHLPECVFNYIITQKLYCS